MPDYDNTNRGAIFNNTRKETDNHPDRTGSIDVDGVDYWINGWLKKSAKGQSYMSLSVKKKDEQAAAPPVYQPPADSPPPPADGDLDDDIPF